jgi:hypothetical protein
MKIDNAKIKRPFAEDGDIFGYGIDLDCALPTGEFSPRFEVGATGGFGFLNPHLVFLRG